MPLLILAIVLILVIGTTTTVYLRRPSAAEVTAVPKLSKRSDKRRKYMHTLLLEWADGIDRHGVGEWLHGLPLEDVNILTKDVSAYADDMGFDLFWVLDGQIDDVDLYDHVNQTVFKYIQSFYLASSFQDDMQLYKVLVEFLNNIGSRRFRPKAEAIYKRLHNEGIIPDADPETLFESRNKRIHHIEESIREAAQSQRSALKVAVRDIIILNEES